MINKTHKNLKNLIIILVLSLSLNTFADINENLSNFKVITTDGTIYNSDNLKDKFVLINFWATWCPPCIKEIPEISEFYNQNKDDIIVIGMNYEKLSNQEIDDFMYNFKAKYPNASYIENKEMFDKFSIRVMPTTLVYAPNGKIISRYEGIADMDFLVNITSLE